MNKWIWIIISVILLFFILNYKTKKDWEVISVSTAPKTQVDIPTLTVLTPKLPFTVHTFPNRLTKQQCKQLCVDARPDLKPSRSANLLTYVYQDLLRTSTSCTIVTKETDYVRQMASQLSGYPISHIEYAQVVRYEEGQGFEVHYDTNPNDKTTSTWSRVATFMVYLNDEFIGGETEFPFINNIITPETGMGVFWWNVVGGELIPESKHKGRYIISGTKWIINTWVHSRAIIETENGTTPFLNEFDFSL